MTIHLKVITPRKLLAEADAEAVYIPTLEGEIGVLPGHRPLFTAVGRGVLSFRADGDDERFSVDGGFAEIRPDQVLVVTEAGEDEKVPSSEDRG
jgi:F-type H+-transporting ATPase subunit epsilon